MRGAFSCLRPYEDALLTMTVHSLFRAMVLHLHQPHNKLNGQRGEAELEFRCGILHSKRSQRNRLSIDTCTPALLAQSEKSRYEFEAGLSELALTSVISHLWNSRLARRCELESVTERAYVASANNTRFLYEPCNRIAEDWSRNVHPTSLNATSTATSSNIKTNSSSNSNKAESSSELTNSVDETAVDTIDFLRSTARKFARSYKLQSAIAKERVVSHDICLPNWSLDLRLALSVERPLHVFENMEKRLLKEEQCRREESSTEKKKNDNNNINFELNSVVLDASEILMLTEYLGKTLHVHPFFHLQLSRRCICNDLSSFDLSNARQVITIPQIHHPIVDFHCELEFNIAAIYKEWRRLTGCRLDTPVMTSGKFYHNNSNMSAIDARRSAIHEKAVRDPFLRQIASDALSLLQYIGTECT